MFSPSLEELLAGIVGQEHLTKEGAPFRLWLEAMDSSVVLVGPPGCGKTMLLKVVKETGQGQMVDVAALLADFRKALGQAQVLLVEEVDRADAARADELAKVIDAGKVVVGTARRWGDVPVKLRSRCIPFQLRALTREEIAEIVRRQVGKPIDDDALSIIVAKAGGDVRNVVKYVPVLKRMEGPITRERIEELVAVEGGSMAAYKYENDEVVSALYKALRMGWKREAFYWVQVAKRQMSLR